MIMTSLRIFLLTAGFTLHAVAQNPGAENVPGPDEVQRAIDEFNRLKEANASNQNEVTVVLEPPTAIEAPESADNGDSSEEPSADGDFESPVEQLLLLNGNSLEETPSTVAAAEKAGPNVRVQSIREGEGKIDPTTINVRSSFPVKPLIQAPSGWQLQPSETAPVFTQDVEVQPGTVITLDITPHILVPSTDGISSFAISEPGYEPEKGYRQEKTVSAVLGESIDQLDRDAVKIGNVLSDLGRLLGSLPEPQTEEEKNAESQ